MVAPMPMQRQRQDQAEIARGVRARFFLRIDGLAKERGLKGEDVMGMARLHLADPSQLDMTNYSFALCLLAVAVLDRASELGTQACDDLRRACVDQAFTAATSSWLAIRDHAIKHGSDLAGRVASVLLKADLHAGYVLSRLKAGSEVYESEIKARRLTGLEAAYLVRMYWMSKTGQVLPLPGGNGGGA